MNFYCHVRFKMKIREQFKTRWSLKRELESHSKNKLHLECPIAHSSQAIDDSFTPICLISISRTKSDELLLMFRKTELAVLPLFLLNKCIACYEMADLTGAD